jgi:SAM-dependent methyltransferase
MSGFVTRDAAAPEFWDERFAAGYTPWDARGVPPALARFVAREKAALGPRVLIPGCGSAYEAAALDAAGFAVTAIDYSPQALARARAVLPATVAARVLRQADFFAFDTEPFDWIYERAFLPALPPRMWADWARRLAQLTVAGGALAGFFVVDPAVAEPRRGPPFAVTSGELLQLLAEPFAPVDDMAIEAHESIAAFAGRERWMLWRRR